MIPKETGDNQSPFNEIPADSAISRQNTLEQDNPIMERPQNGKQNMVERRLSGTKGLVIGLGIGITLTLVGTSLFSSAPQPEAVSTSSTLVKSEANPQTVTVATVSISPIARTLQASGTVAAFELIPVMAQETGLPIKEIVVERGDVVEQGQILAKLNDSRLQAELVQAQGAVAAAKANLAQLQAGNRAEEIAMAQERVNSSQAALVQAESDLDLVRKRVARNKTLQAEGAIAQDRLDEILNQERIRESNLEQAQASLEEARQELAQLRAGARPEEIQQAQAELAQAQGQLQLVEAQLADTVIVAPVRGKIASRRAKLGDLTASAALFEIIENDRLELQLKIPETLVGEVLTGQRVEISSDRNRNLQLSGQVREIDPVINGDSRQAMVKVDLPAGKGLKPGMFLQAAITTSTATGKTIPMKALLPQADGSATAFVMQPDNTVKAQTVAMGEILPSERVEILNGLETGDRVVVKGAAYLKNGDRVKVMGVTVEQ